MIRVCIIRNSGRIREITLKDHAQSSFGEYDMICLAVSTMLITTVNGINEVAKGDIESRIESGDSAIRVFETDNDKLEKMDVLLDTFALGLENLSKEYPTFVKLEYLEEKDD